MRTRLTFAAVGLMTLLMTAILYAGPFNGPMSNQNSSFNGRYRGLMEQHTGFVETAAVKEYNLIIKSNAAMEVRGFKAKCLGGGSATVKIQVDDTDITGCTGINILNNHVVTKACTLTTLPVGGKLDFVVTANTACTNLAYQIDTRRLAQDPSLLVDDLGPASANPDEFEGDTFLLK